MDRRASKQRDYCFLKIITSILSFAFFFSLLPFTTPCLPPLSPYTHKLPFFISELWPGLVNRKLILRVFRGQGCHIRIHKLCTEQGHQPRGQVELLSGQTSTCWAGLGSRRGCLCPFTKASSACQACASGHTQPKGFWFSFCNHICRQ